MESRRGGPHSVMVTTPDSQAGGPGLKSRCRLTNFGQFRTHPFPNLTISPKKGKGYPEDGILVPWPLGN